MWGMLYKHITDSTTVQPYTLLAPARTALADILYKNGENGPSEGAMEGFLVLTRLCLGWSCSLFSLLRLFIADSASQRDCHEVLRSFRPLVWPDNLNGKSKGFGRLHQTQEWEIGQSTKRDLVAREKQHAAYEYTLRAYKSISCTFTKRHKNGKQIRQNVHTHNRTYTRALPCTPKPTHRLWKSN